MVVYILRVLLVCSDYQALVSRVLSSICFLTMLASKVAWNSRDECGTQIHNKTGFQNDMTGTASFQQ